MKKNFLVVPANINYLSEWFDFDSLLPQGQVIVDKGGCGCGGTEYYLQSNKPVLLVSPRKELINCKMRTNNVRVHKMFYFDRTKKVGMKKETIEETTQRLQNYLCNPFGGDDFVPKVIVTYDSLAHVLTALREWGYLDNFTIIVDEFTCIFTDVKLKGTIELNLINQLSQLPNHIVYISATPISEVYLDRLPEFSQVPYVILKWDESRFNKTIVRKHTMRSTCSAIVRIIEGFRKDGYFSAIKQTGKRSTEAVFFLNNVRDIVSVINQCGLTPDDTLVVCADDEKNKAALAKVGHKIGHVAAEGEANKTFTFVTKASFEGTDFYSQCSTTYVFADPDKNSLCLDISIDLPQIAGRCRTRSNPFRNYLFYFCKTSDVEKIKNEKILIDKRQNETKMLLQDYATVTRLQSLQKLIDAQASKHYSMDYLDVQKLSDDTGKVVSNELAYLADLRAIEIKEEQYKSNFTIISSFEQRNFVVNEKRRVFSERLAKFYNEYFQDENFARRMKLYVDTVSAHPELQTEIAKTPDIDIDIIRYYDVIETEKIKAVGYRLGALRDLYQTIKAKEDVAAYLSGVLKSGQFYDNPTIKNLIKAAYDNCGVKTAPKATDITNYMESAQQTKITVNGKRQQGYRI